LSANDNYFNSIQQQLLNGTLYLRRNGRLTWFFSNLQRFSNSSDWVCLSGNGKLPPSTTTT